MFTALLIVQVLLGLSIIGLVLLQQGKGADMGAAFGAGASGSVFGARGGSSFFTRATAVLATAFFVNSILLSSPLVRQVHDPESTVTSTVPAPEDDVPPVEETGGADEAIDLPPADLPPMDDMPEVDVSTEPPAQDLPAVDDTPPVEDTVTDASPADLPPADDAPADDKPE